MKDSPLPPEDIEIAVILNRCLVNRDADGTMRAFCNFLEQTNLKVSAHLLDQIPVKPTSDLEN